MFNKVGFSTNIPYASYLIASINQVGSRYCVGVTFFIVNRSKSVQVDPPGFFTYFGASRYELIESRAMAFSDTKRFKITIQNRIITSTTNA